MDKYDELMARYELVKQAWMAEVEAARKAGWDHNQFNSPGVVFRGTLGTLWMQGKLHGRTVVDLTIEPGETEVTITRL